MWMSHYMWHPYFLSYRVRVSKAHNLNCTCQIALRAQFGAKKCYFCMRKKPIFCLAIILKKKYNKK